MSIGVHGCTEYSVHAQQISAVDLRPDSPTRPMDRFFFLSVRHPNFVCSLVASKPFPTHMTSLAGCLHYDMAKLAPQESRPFQLGTLGLNNAREAVSCVDVVGLYSLTKL